MRFWYDDGEIVARVVDNVCLDPVGQLDAVRLEKIVRSSLCDEPALVEQEQVVAELGRQIKIMEDCDDDIAFAGLVPRFLQAKLLLVKVHR